MRAIHKVLATVAAMAVGLGQSADRSAAGEEGGQSAPPASLSLDECRALWNLAAGRSDLGRDQAKPYVSSFEAVDANGDGKITNAEFRAGCEAGHVHPARRSQD